MIPLVVLDRHKNNMEYLWRSVAYKNKMEMKSCLLMQQEVTYGRMGRKFHISPYQSWVFSYITHRNLLLDETHRYLIFYFAKIFLDVVEELFDVSLRIKWPNDIYFEHKKLGGILVEWKSDYLVVGFGANLYQEEFPDWIKDRAISLYQITGKNHIDLVYFTRYFLEHLERNLPWFQEYAQTHLIYFLKEKLIWKNEWVMIYHQEQDSQCYGEGFLHDIGPYGQLILKNEDGETKEYFSGVLRCRSLQEQSEESK